jgi:hypothetical protein
MGRQITINEQELQNIINECVANAINEGFLDRIKAGYNGMVQGYKDQKFLDRGSDDFKQNWSYADEKDNFDPFSRRPENTAAMQANDIYKQWRYHFNKSQELLKLYNKIAKKYNLKKLGVGQWAPGEESVRGSVPEFGFNSVRQKYTNDRPVGGYTNIK